MQEVRRWLPPLLLLLLPCCPSHTLVNSISLDILCWENSKMHFTINCGLPQMDFTAFWTLWEVPNTMTEKVNFCRGKFSFYLNSLWCIIIKCDDGDWFDSGYDGSCSNDSAVLCWCWCRWHASIHISTPCTQSWLSQSVWRDTLTRCRQPDTGITGSLP